MQKLSLGDGYDENAGVSTSQINPSVSDNLATNPSSNPSPVVGLNQPPRTARTSVKGTSMASKKSVPVALIAIALGAGILTGFGAYKLQAKTGALPGLGGSGEPIQQIAEGTVSAGEVFGVQDEKTFKDAAEGYLEAGGVDGEGSHHLVRVGGVSQTVYLTSSVTDLSKFEGMEVKVWGETFKAQKAGWFMDVGRVQIVNPSGEKPSEE